MNNKTPGQHAIDKFAEMMISRMEEMKNGTWKKGWIGGKVYGLPQNISGRMYSYSNALFLNMDTAVKGYTTPIYLTFLQVQKEEARVKKGEESMPVIYWDLSIKTPEGKNIDRKKYENLSEEDKEKCLVIPFIKAYNVFNLDQTNLKEVNRDKYDEIVAKFKNPISKDKTGMYENMALDRMFEKQEWVCPIHFSNRVESPHYRTSTDEIFIPKKEQFNIGRTKNDIYKDGMEFYSTVLHEMAHSTGAENRLNRNLKNKFNEPQYAKEELVAELTAANISNVLGFDKRILDNNAAYLDGWISVLKENPKFIVSVMADVNKASDMILREIDKQKISLGEKPFLDKGIDTQKFKDISVFKTKNGEYAIRATYDGKELESRIIDTAIGESILKLKNGEDKDRLINKTLREVYGNFEINKKENNIKIK
ncbi:MAG: DUF1738 domain-containing protein [Prevotella sp.]|nr:DUF1738 domain-containing protein [Prevotella sp.]